jgi:exopolysaccharide production protein ExoZ
LHTAGQNVEERLQRPSRFSGPATLGVDIFFALSGFVMIYSSLQPGKHRPRPLQFIERRIIRIVPLYWVATTLKLIALAASPRLSLHTTAFGLGSAGLIFIPARPKR